MRRLLLAAAVALGSAGCGSEEPYGEPRVVAGNAGSVRVEWRFRPETPVPGVPFDVEVRALDEATGEGRADVRIAIGALRPSDRALPDTAWTTLELPGGTWRAERVQLAPPGPWTLYADVTLAGVTERAQVEVGGS